MKRFVFTLIFSLSCLGQQTTELYIPIGKSPGLSREGKTVIGKIEEVKVDKICISKKTFFITNKTKIFLDRSEIKQPNSYGSITDLKTNNFSEIYAPTNNVAVWIKVRLTTETKKYKK